MAKIGPKLFRAFHFKIDMLSWSHGRHRIPAGSGASGSAPGILSTCHDLRGGESVASRDQPSEESGPSLVSVGHFRLGNRSVRARPERLRVSLDGVASG